MEIVGRISNLVSDSSIRKENRWVCLCFCSVVSVSLRSVFLLPSSILRRFVPLFYFLSFDQREREREEKNISEIGYKEQTEKGIDIIDVADFSRTRPTGERNCIRKRKRQRSRAALFSLKSKALFHPSCFFRVLRLAFHYHSPPSRFFCSFSRGRDALLVFKIISEWNSRTVTSSSPLLEKTSYRDLQRLTCHGPVPLPAAALAADIHHCIHVSILIQCFAPLNFLTSKFLSPHLLFVTVNNYRNNNGCLERWKRWVIGIPL